MTAADDNPSMIESLLQRAAGGDQQCWRMLLEQHREQLRRVVSLRLDRRLQGRIDASDVLQEAAIEAWERLSQYLKKPDMPFYLWLRFLTCQKLLVLHRHHLGTAMRAAGREVSIYRSGMPEASSAVLANRLLGKESRPSEVAVRAEMKLRLEQALDHMDPLDREVLALRHFEQLSNAETAGVLQIQEAAASKRYIRALKRLKEILAGSPDAGDEESS